MHNAVHCAWYSATPYIEHSTFGRQHQGVASISERPGLNHHTRPTLPPISLLANITTLSDSTDLVHIRLIVAILPWANILFKIAMCLFIEGVLAHGFYPTDGGLHFDGSERWTLNEYDGINVYQTAVHEIGHLLG